jgi:hypothetical protein
MMSDSQRLDWLYANTQRLKDVYWRIENEGGTVRDAIDFLSDGGEGTKNE